MFPGNSPLQRRFMREWAKGINLERLGIHGLQVRGRQTGFQGMMPIKIPGQHIPPKCGPVDSQSVPTLSPSSPGGPTGPAGPGSPTGPWMPSLPAGPWGPFSPWKHKNRQVTPRALQPSHYSPLRFYSAANDSGLDGQDSKAGSS